MTAADSPQALPPAAPHNARWYAARIAHLLCMLALIACMAGISELRTTALGAPVVLTITLGGTLIVLDDLLAPRLARFRGRRRPFLTLTSLAGLLMLGCAAFGIAECFHAPIGAEPVWTPQIGGRDAPIGRWFFLTFVLFGGLALYGALTLASGTGLLAPRPAPPPD